MAKFVADRPQTEAMVRRIMRSMPTRDRTLSSFGQNVAKLRSERGLSQDQLAEKADLDRTYVSGIERGVRNPGIKTVIRIAKALGTDLNSLCAGIKV